MTAPAGSCPIVRLMDVTDPKAAQDHGCVRTLEDGEGNRYVLLTVAQYLKLLHPGLMAPAAPVREVVCGPAGSTLDERIGGNE